MDWMIERLDAYIRALLGSTWDKLWSPIVDGWPIYHAYWVFALIFLGCVGATILVRIFIPFDTVKKWASAGFGLIALLAFMRLLGQRQMYYQMLERMKKKRK